MHTGYAAFLDVLGFSALVAGDQEGRRIEEYLQALASTVEAAAGDERVSYLVFSDSIVITTKDDTLDSFHELLRRCSHLFGTLLGKGIALKGAIAAGHYVSEKTNSGRFVAGRAIIDAYSFEQKQDWVGVMLTPTARSTFPAISNHCLIQESYSAVADADWRRHLMDKLYWGAFIQPCERIPFHKGEYYDGLAVLPTSGVAKIPNLQSSLSESIDHLVRLRGLAPDPSSQAKYQKSIAWLTAVGTRVRAVADKLEREQQMAQVLRQITGTPGVV